MNRQKGHGTVAYLVLAALIAIAGIQVFDHLRSVTVSRLAYEVAQVGNIEYQPLPGLSTSGIQGYTPPAISPVSPPSPPGNATGVTSSGPRISDEARDHYARNCENDQFFINEGLYGRTDLTLDDIEDAGTHGMKQASDIENQYHQFGEGNENNIKFTSRVADPESFYQRNWSNRYGRYEIVVRPNIDADGNPVLNENGDATYTHVTDPINMGTLNRGNNPIDHWTMDVRPYQQYGNTANGLPYTCP